LSEPEPADAWAGRTGLVHQAVMQDWPDLSAHQVYACGVPVMVEAAQRDFCAVRLATRGIFCRCVHLGSRQAGAKAAATAAEGITRPVPAARPASARTMGAQS
jgi:NAD(P)H-flavin reductase